MNHDDGDRVGSPNLQEILAELLSLSPVQQQERIERLGLNEQELGELLSRIGHAAPTEDGLPEEPPGVAAHVETIRLSMNDPEQIGDYRVVRKISEGGMGVVYEARHQRLDQRVALKLIRPGLMTPHMLRRFEYEATVLARLDHAGIARIFYAGIWDGGAGPQPYFAMEYVEGRPLDEYLKENRVKLKLPHLVELFHAICESVQHAHGKGIVHRDLKPDNILITSDGKPKVLDFGVAFVIDPDQHLTTMRTESGQIIGTVPYMAPEQVRGQVDEIEQATDVYALGVIGYEIFADRMPYPVKGCSLPEAARMICEDEPSRLSSIRKSLRGDVETIVQKALEKEKTRRFATAGEIAGQVRRYLNNEPLTIGPPSTWYNLRKFAKRNKALVGGVAATLLVLVAGVIVSAAFALESNRQRLLAEQRQNEAEQRQKQTEAVVSFLTKDVFENASPENLPDKAERDVIFSKMIEPAIKRIGEQFSQDPLTLSTVQNSLALVLHSMGRLSDAEPLYREAVAGAVASGSLGPAHPHTKQFAANHAKCLDALGRHDEAAAVRKQFGLPEPTTMPSMHPTEAQLNPATGPRLSQPGPDAGATAYHRLRRRRRPPRPR